MTYVVSHFLALGVGAVICWAATRRQVRKAKAEVFALLYARHSIDASPEDAIRRAGC